MSQDEPVTLPADPVEPRASLPDLPLVAPSTTIESAAQNALIERVNALSKMLIQSGTTVIQSNASGAFRINYPEPFRANPRVLAQVTSSGDFFVQPPDAGGAMASPAWFEGFVRRVTDGSGVANSIGLRVDWIAIGERP